MSLDLQLTSISSTMLEDAGVHSEGRLAFLPTLDVDTAFFSYMKATIDEVVLNVRQALAYWLPRIFEMAQMNIRDPAKQSLSGLLEAADLSVLWSLGHSPAVIDGVSTRTLTQHTRAGAAILHPLADGLSSLSQPSSARATSEWLALQLAVALFTALVLSALGRRGATADNEVVLASDNVLPPLHFISEDAAVDLRALVCKTPTQDATSPREGLHVDQPSEELPPVEPLTPKSLIHHLLKGTMDTYLAAEVSENSSNPRTPAPKATPRRSSQLSLGTTPTIAVRARDEEAQSCSATAPTPSSRRSARLSAKTKP